MRTVPWILVAAACGGGATKGARPEPPQPMSEMDSKMMDGGAMGADDASAYGPLTIGADWNTYTKLNAAAFRSETHGGRMVDVYVNAVGLDAYKSGGPMPVGSVVVKTSHQTDGS